MQHDEPRRPGAARPSLLSAAAQPEAARSSILNELDASKKPLRAGMPAARPRWRKAVLGGLGLAVVLLGGAAAWLAMEQGAPDTALAQATASSQAAAPAPGASDRTVAATAAAGVAGAAAAAPAGRAPDKTPNAAPAAAHAPAPGNSDDLVAALAAPSHSAKAVPAAATIQDESPAQREPSLRDMLDAPAGKSAAVKNRQIPAPSATPSARTQGKGTGKEDGKGSGKEAGKGAAKGADKEAGKGAANAAAGERLARNGKASHDGKARPSGKAAPAKPAPVQSAPDSDVALLAALVAHTHAGRPPKQPETLPVKLKQCSQLAGKGAEQCRARTCAGAKDDPLCKPAVTAASEGASS